MVTPQLGKISKVFEENEIGSLRKMTEKFSVKSSHSQNLPFFTVLHLAVKLIALQSEKFFVFL